MSNIYVGETPISAVFMGGKRYGMRVGYDRLLPTGYTQLEYIEATGTQYIDTGIYCTSSLAVSLKIQYTNIIITSQYTGAILDNGTLKRYHMGLEYDNTFTVGIRNTYAVTVAKNSNINTFYISSAECKINDTTATGDWSTGLPESLTFWLFYRNAAGRSSWTQQYCRAKLYSCDMLENGVLVRDFIPAKRDSDNKIGLYDTVSKTFFTDANGGNFVGGDPV